MLRAIVLKARQLGVSTDAEGQIYHTMKYEPGHRAVVMAHRDDAATALYGMFRTFLENDPDAPEVVTHNSEQIVFANGSRIRIMVAGTVATGAGRAFTFQLAHLSEVAFWNNASEHLNAVLRAVPRVPGSRVVIESTANGTTGPFYAMASAALRGVGEYRLYFLPWFDHKEYAIGPPPGWRPSEIVSELAERYELTPAQLHWAEVEATNMAAMDHTSLDELPWRFRQEYPSNIQEAFRAGRAGGFIPGSIVAAARERVNPHQGDMPLILGCDFATGGGGGDAEVPNAQSASTEGVMGSEDGDANVFMSRRGRVMGRECYDRFRDRNTLSVANRLAAVIDRLHPDRVFMDRGGGGAGVFDVLAARGYAHIMELVDFGMAARPVDERRYRNKRAEMTGDLRDWLADGGDIPDEDLLEAEITSEWVISEDERGLTIAPKKLVRQKLGLSPDGADAAKVTFAAPVRRGSSNVIVGGAGR